MVMMKMLMVMVVMVVMMRIKERSQEPEYHLPQVSTMMIW